MTLLWRGMTNAASAAGPAAAAEALSWSDGCCGLSVQARGQLRRAATHGAAHELSSSRGALGVVCTRCSLLLTLCSHVADTDGRFSQLCRVLLPAHVMSCSCLVGGAARTTAHATARFPMFSVASSAGLFAARAAWLLQCPWLQLHLCALVFTDCHRPTLQGALQAHCAASVVVAGCYGAIMMIVCMCVGSFYTTDHCPTAVQAQAANVWC